MFDKSDILNAYWRFINATNRLDAVTTIANGGKIATVKIRVVLAMTIQNQGQMTTQMYLMNWKKNYDCGEYYYYWSN